MKKTIYLALALILFISFICNSQESCLQESFNQIFTDLIISNEGISTKENKRYLNNEAKIIFRGRKELFSHLDFEPYYDLSVVEIFDLERPSDLYSIAIKHKSNVYYLVMDDSLKYKFVKSEFEIFKKKYKMMGCMLEKIENEFESLKEYGGASFHFTPIITRINKIYDIKTYIARDVCSY